MGFKPTTSALLEQTSRHYTTELTQCLEAGQIPYYHIDPLHARHTRRLMPRSPCWWANRFTCINAAWPKMRTSLHNAQHTLCSELYMKTHSEIAHQYSAFKIFLMMTSDEIGQYYEITNLWTYGLNLLCESGESSETPCTIFLLHHTCFYFDFLQKKHWNQLLCFVDFQIQFSWT